MLRCEGLVVVVASWMEKVGISIPIVQAPVGNACCPQLVAAVSSAGGLGMYSAAWRTPSELRTLIRQTTTLTSGPFGVNLTLPWPEAQHELLSVGMEEGVRVYSLWWGDVEPFLKRLDDPDVFTMVTVASAEGARRAQDAGADAVVAQGFEAGGHVLGSVATMPLVAAVAGAVSIPVIAAGGIADGRGIAAALCLGASGVWMGTRFVATRESAAHPAYKQAIVDAAETATFHGRVFDQGWPGASHRTLRNRTVEMFVESGPDARNTSEVIGSTDGGAPVHRFSEDEPLQGWSGSIDEMCLYAGQSCGIVHDIPPAASVVRDVWAEANQILSETAGRWA